MQDNGNAVKILEKLGVDPSKMPEEIIKDPLNFDTAMYCCFPGQIRALCMLFKALN